MKSCGRDESIVPVTLPKINLCSEYTVLTRVQTNLHPYTLRVRESFQSGVDGNG